jgi:Mrp family chromosome partitioning ATPase
MVRRSKRNQRPAPDNLRPGDRGDGGLELLDQNGEVVQIASPAVTASLRSMVARARLADEDDFDGLLGLTSTLSGEGVTFITRSLALVLANDTRRRVCIVDLNWWSTPDWPGNDTRGVADLIRGSQPVESLVIPTGTPDVSILPAGAASLSERPVLARSPRLGEILVSLCEAYDHVLLDLPAMRATSEVLTLAEHAGRIAFVVRQGVTPEGLVKKALEEELSGISVLGVILNAASTKVPAMVKRFIPDN